MRIIRYVSEGVNRLAAVTDDDEAYAVADRDLMALMARAQSNGCSPAELMRRDIRSAERIGRPWQTLDLRTPIDAPEVWAAGVTYERSKTARNYEVTQESGVRQEITFYDKVYDADRPELFLKSTSARTVGPGASVWLRGDSRWQVPEPELGLVLGSDGRILGYTVGNDMSCRDIEGENPLYLPQAKVWKRSCSIGPAIRLAETVENPYRLQIVCRILRGGKILFEDSANTSQLKRKYDELIAYLQRDNVLLDGTVLLTGTCIVPPDSFTLVPGDRIEIEIESIGTLINTAESA